MSDLTCPKCKQSDSFRADVIETTNLTLWLNGDVICQKTNIEEHIGIIYRSIQCETCKHKANYESFYNGE